MSEDDAGWQRLDTWLWCARFLRQRTECARFVAEGLVRINRQPTDKPHARLRVGDVLTLPQRHAVVVIEVLGLAPRRGPAAAARKLYREVRTAASGGCGGDADAAYPAALPSAFPAADDRSAR